MVHGRFARSQPDSLDMLATQTEGDFVNTQRVEGHTPRTMGELVKKHASRDTMNTHHGFDMLELSGAAEHICAANTYLAALSIIRKQEKVNEALVRALNKQSQIWMSMAAAGAIEKYPDLNWPFINNALGEVHAALALAKEPA